MKIPKNKNASSDFGRSGRNVTTKLTARVAIVLLSVMASATLCVFAMSNTAAPAMNPSKNITTTDAPNGVPSVDIGSAAGPLTNIFIGNELSCQVGHISDAALEFYPPSSIPGDCGTFVAIMGGTLYTPNFPDHSGGSGVVGLLGLPNPVPFMPISQTFTPGTGTAANPFGVVTVVSLPGTALSIQQTDTYVIGDESYRTDIMIINNGGGPASGVLYRAGDAFLSGSDFGYGFTEVSGTRKSVGCSSNPNNVPSGKIEEWVPLTGGNNFYHDSYNAVWTLIGTRAPFPDTCQCTTLLDNGAGISWNFSIPAGGFATFSQATTLSLTGKQALVTSKTADSPTSMVGLQNGYAITIENPNPNPVTLSSITDTLPVGFNYLSGSTTGATTNDPSFSGQMLTWAGPFVVAANSSVSLHFAVVASIAGEYFNQAGGQANGGFTVIGTGPTAPISVAPCAGTIFGESFDGVAAPALPQDWMANGPAPLWMTSTTNPDTPLNAAFVAAPGTTSDNYLDSPDIAITSASAQVSFRSNFDLESGFDGGVLEISINGGAFTDILDAAVGGSFVTGGYNATIDPSAVSPIAGRMAWSGSSCGYICAVANLGANVSGTTIKLRFRVGTNSTVASPGWRVDTIQVLAGGSVCGPCVTATLSPAKLLNASARLLVGTGAQVLIGGFHITGTAPKRVVLRGLGPSLVASGIPNPLTNPILELRDSLTNVVLSDDDWQDDPAQAAQLSALGLAPANNLESGIVLTLPPCSSYTVILSGSNGGTGVGLLEIYDIDPAAQSEIATFSARGFVQTGGNVMIGGFILGGNINNTRVALRGMGPTLPPSLSPLLADPTLELHGPSPFVTITNDNWQSNATAATEFPLQGLVPLPLESGIFTLLPPDTFTAILGGGTGMGLVEIYNVH